VANPESTTTPSADPLQTVATAKPQSKCPPPKIVVRQGGTTEPSIKLAGGAAGQTSQAQAIAKPMWDAAEENLKKLAGRTLTATEQDMVTQIRQFMDQSKSAASTGDAERARTFAWKAQTLSEDLVKPAQ
jgi:hypothetical protein